MNNYSINVLKFLNSNKFTNQRDLAEKTGFSLGNINNCLKFLQESGYLNSKKEITKKGKMMIEMNSPKQAVILAAGFGTRMVPINLKTPKALLEVRGEILIERLIRQLHEVGITDIKIVVGFMKESFEYLIDQFDVDLIVNKDYIEKNNYHSLYLARNYLENSYIVPSDVWFEKNPFNKIEIESWYMVSKELVENGHVRVNRKNQIVRTKGTEPSNKMKGLCYMNKETAKIAKQNFETNGGINTPLDYWEKVICDPVKMIVNARVVSKKEAIDINTYEDLRELDKRSSDLKNDAIEIIQEALNVAPEKIEEITVLKKGMTNRSFLFSCEGKRYIMRIPGEGTEQLINRKEEAAVYSKIAGKNISDKVIYINPENGYKITEYMENARNCDPLNNDEIKKCMSYLRDFHEKKIKVEHEFDIFKQIEFYESLWEGKPSVFRDYQTTKQKVLELKNYIDAHKKEYSLTHIDAVPDNFIFVNEKGKEVIHLIDWEYAGMQDTDVDIAMFCIYSLFNKEQIDNLINLYYVEGCPKETQIKIYCYIASCGLLWSNWCEYKRTLGVEFGEYSLRQYRYAKDYYKIVMEELKND